LKNPTPTFPPLLSGHKLEASKNLMNWTTSRASKGKLGAGDLVWSDDVNSLRFTIVLEPEVVRDRCGEILYVVMAAFGDAAGALCPPEISIQYQWPSTIQMNGASIGYAEVRLSEDETDGIPDWLVVGIDVRINPLMLDMDPGEKADQTTMWDEGCGDITRTELVESVSRHIVNWIHTWSEDGFKPVYDTWWGRISDKEKLVIGFRESGELMGMDESGNALVKSGDKTSVIRTLDVLEKMNAGQV